MKRTRLWLVFAVILLAAPAYALDANALNRTLTDLAEGISQTAYSFSERAGTAERETYAAAAAKADRSERELKKFIAGLETAEDVKLAALVIEKFGRKNKLHAHTSSVALKILKERANFLKVSLPQSNRTLESTVLHLNESADKSARTPDLLLSRNQRRLIMVELPIAEAVISLVDNSKKRRVEALEDLFKRHECRVLASTVDDSDGDQYNYYISGKKFVLEALMNRFKGSEVSGNLKASLLVTTGGFWGKKQQEFQIMPQRNAPEKGSLSWYQAVLEKDPFKYLAENNYAALATLGAVEDLAGEKQLRLKNAKIDLWVLPANGTKRDAIYRNSVEFGDIYVAAR